MIDVRSTGRCNKCLGWPEDACVFLGYRHVKVDSHGRQITPHHTKKTPETKINQKAKETVAFVDRTRYLQIVIRLEPKFAAFEGRLLQSGALPIELRRLTFIELMENL